MRHNGKVIIIKLIIRAGLTFGKLLLSNQKALKAKNNIQLTRKLQTPLLFLSAIQHQLNRKGKAVNYINYEVNIQQLKPP